MGLLTAPLILFVQVIPVKNAKGTRLPVTACSYCPNATHIVAGGEVRRCTECALRLFAG